MDPIKKLNKDIFLIIFSDACFIDLCGHIHRAEPFLRS